MTDRIRAKIEIAEALQAQSALIFAFRVRHFDRLSAQDRLELKEASRKLNSRADEVLEDALEEGVAGAETLLSKLKGHTDSLSESAEDLAKVGQVLAIANKVAKAAAGVVSGGIPSALGLL